MSGRLKIQEIASLSGVSISTVSRVLSGKSNTSTGVKQTVLECARTLGVLGEIHAERLLFNHAVVFAPSRAFDVRTDIFYYKVVQGIRVATENRDVRLSFCAIEENDSDVALFLKRIGNPACDAVIVVGIDDPRIHEVAADIGKPCVLVNCRDRGMRLDAVLPDHFGIGEYSANYLIEMGHRNIVPLLCLRRSTMEHRLDGIHEAFAAHNIPFAKGKQLIVTSGFSADEARSAITQYFAGKGPEQRPTAILAGGDYMAVGAKEALDALKLSVPGDVSVMSMDGFNLADIHDVPLTAVHVPRDELGAQALRLLQSRIIQPDAPCNTLLLGGKLVARSSVKRLGRRKVKGAVSIREHGLYDS